jgi:kinetochore protein NDC80
MDMRYIKEVDTQRKHLKGVTDYLHESGYSGVPPPRNIRALGAKDFQSMFKFLFEKLRPDHVFNKKFEDEVMDIIRELNYPLLDSISPKALLAVGALHSNPSFFALLFWLMKRCRDKEQTTKLKQKEKEMSLANSIVSGKLFFNYSNDSYQDLIAGSLDFESRARVLKSNFGNVLLQIKGKRISC